MCRVERWSTRTLGAKIDGMLYERIALSKKPEALIRQELEALRAEDRLTPDIVFRDPYLCARFSWAQGHLVGEASGGGNSTGNRDRWIAK